jgi:hypothetical protein
MAKKIMQSFMKGFKKSFKGGSKPLHHGVMGISEGIMRMGSNVHSFYGQPLRTAHKKRHKTKNRVKVGGSWYYKK